MIQLPIEILIKIINQLNLKDKLMLNCVCKLLNSIINKNIKINKLIICDLIPLSERWFYCLSNIDLNDHLKIDNYDLIDHKLNRSIFLNLKSLFITNIYQKELCMDFLNLFNQLNHLEITNLQVISKRKKELILNLPKLNLLNLDSISIKTKIVLRTINLTKLKFNLIDQYVNRVKFNYPESIKILEKNEFHKNDYIFKNLEQFYCYKIDETINLNNWLKLELILFYEDIEDWFNLIRQKTDLKLTKLRIYLFGIEFNQIANDKILNYLSNNYINQSTIQFYGANFTNLSIRNPFTKYVNYNDLEEYLDLNSIEFISRFVNLIGIYTIKNISNYNLFISIFKNYNLFKSLELRSSNLDQQFFNQLPKLTPYLTCLKIFKLNNLDFEFLTQLDYLLEFYTDLELNNLEFVCKIIKDKKFECFNFNYRTIEILIECNCISNEFKLTINDNVTNYYKCLDDLIIKLNKLEN